MHLGRHVRLCAAPPAAQLSNVGACFGKSEVEEARTLRRRYARGRGGQLDILELEVEMAHAHAMQVGDRADEPCHDAAHVGLGRPFIDRIAPMPPLGPILHEPVEELLAFDALEDEDRDLDCAHGRDEPPIAKGSEDGFRKGPLRVERLCKMRHRQLRRRHGRVIVEEANDVGVRLNMLQHQLAAYSRLERLSRRLEDQLEGDGRVLLEVDRTAHDAKGARS